MAPICALMQGNHPYWDGRLFGLESQERAWSWLGDKLFNVWTELERGKGTQYKNDDDE
jgi:hypothetical protein